MKVERTLPKTYTPAETEPAISALWLQARAFHAVPDDRGSQDRYVIMMPLPNVTGALHMGHAMDNVMQDLLIRWRRMKGHNTLWMPGTDHAGIATQAVVEKRLKELEGLTRHDVGREGLIERIWRWKDQYQARIIAQQQRMGCSCDWERQRFTMDKVCARAVRHAFFRMFRDNLIFRGKRLVNWDPFLRTTISDDEMYYETVQGFFWHLRYPVIDPKKGEPEFVVVATTRPETMLGDTAVAIHPDPERALDEKIGALEKEYTGNSSESLSSTIAELRERMKNMLPTLVRLRDMARAGRQVRLPLLDRPIPLILDEWAKPELGSGCVKITPAHDHNDYAVWTRHREQIGIINILNPDGTLSGAAGPYAGLDRFEARERVVRDLEKAGLLEKSEEREIEIGHSDRSKTPVEPFLSDQWFIRMGDIEGGVVMGEKTKKEFRSPGLVQAAMVAVIDGRVKIHPERYTKTYLDWLSEKRDWPISRQLWWGHQIPVWSAELIRKDAPAVVKKLAAGVEKALGLPRERLGEKIVMKITDPESGRQIVIADWTGLTGNEFPGNADEKLRIEICLIEDSEALLAFLEGEGFVRDPDVLDTWFSSALWPFSTLGWPDPETAGIDDGQASLGASGGAENCLDYYYPGSCLVTARDIITLWVARMVIAGLYNLGDIPFTDVFIHANILDGKGVRMSKSKGNGIDPVDIIEAYGTDAMRYILCDMQTGTQDIRLPVTAVCPSCGFHNDLATTLHGKNIFCYVCGKNLDGSMKQGACGKEFDVLGTLPDLPQAKLTSERFEIGRAFCTKLWNSARFALMNLSAGKPAGITRERLRLEDNWILSRLSRTIRETERGLTDYNPSLALNAVRDFFWGSLCDWYLEAVKPRLTGSGPDRESAAAVLAFCLDQVLRLFHPFVPFITEFLWQKLSELVPERGIGQLVQAEPSPLLMTAEWPSPIGGLEDEEAETFFAHIQSVIRAIREVRAERTIPPKQTLAVTLKPLPDKKGGYEKAEMLIRTLAGTEPPVVDPRATRPAGAVTVLAGETTLFIHDIIDDQKERVRLKDEIKIVETEIEIVRKKLGNKEFVSRAPEEVVLVQKKKLEDAETRRSTLLHNEKMLENS